jgi:hypothetical protein
LTDRPDRILPVIRESTRQTKLFSMIGVGWNNCWHDHGPREQTGRDKSPAFLHLVFANPVLNENGWVSAQNKTQYPDTSRFERWCGLIDRTPNLYDYVNPRRAIYNGGISMEGVLFLKSNDICSRYGRIFSTARTVQMFSGG